MKTAIQKLIDTIEATGGIESNPDGTYSPVADHDWIDLADVYLAACAEVNRPAMIDAESGAA